MDFYDESTHLSSTKQLVATVTVRKEERRILPVISLLDDGFESHTYPDGFGAG